MTNKAEQIAEGAVAVSVGTFLGITLGEWDAIVHIGAGVVAILSGLAALIYYLHKIHLIRNWKDQDKGS